MPRVYPKSVFSLCLLFLFTTAEANAVSHGRDCTEHLVSEESTSRTRGSCTETKTVVISVIVCENRDGSTTAYSKKVEGTRCFDTKSLTACGPFFGEKVDGKFRAGNMRTSSNITVTGGGQSASAVTRTIDILYPESSTVVETGTDVLHDDSCF